MNGAYREGVVLSAISNPNGNRPIHFGGPSCPSAIAVSIAPAVAQVFMEKYFAAIQG
jgi:hypothetical protein